MHTLEQGEISLFLATLEYRINTLFVVYAPAEVIIFLSADIPRDRLRASPHACLLAC